MGKVSGILCSRLGGSQASDILQLLGDTNRVHQPLLEHFTEFFRFFLGYKITIHCLLRLFFNHTSFLVVETVRATAQQPPGKFCDIVFVGQDLFLPHPLKFVILKLFYRSRPHKLWRWWVVTKCDTNHSYIYIYLNKDRPTWCHLFYYFTIYCSTCFEC